MTTLINTLSLEDFLTSPETKPATEYIDGKLYPKPMPQGEHSLIQRRLIIALDAALEPQKIGSVFPELRCTFGGRSLVPDISVYESARIPRNDKGRILNRFDIPPDWVVEILSPEQSSTIVIEKIIFCLKAGTKLGWFIDPSEESVIVFEGGSRPNVFSGDSPLPVLEAMGDWKLTSADIFGWLSE